MPRISVTLPHEEHQALCDLALREWREVPDQAAYLIVDGLRRHAHVGDLPAARASRSPSPLEAAVDADQAVLANVCNGQEVDREPTS